MHWNAGGCLGAFWAGKGPAPRACGLQWGDRVSCVSGPVLVYASCSRGVDHGPPFTLRPKCAVDGVVSHAVTLVVWDHMYALSVGVR